MDPQTAYLERLRPPGGKRSSKRDLIVNVFLGLREGLENGNLHDANRLRARIRAGVDRVDDLVRTSGDATRQGHVLESLSAVPCVGAHER